MKVDGELQVQYPFGIGGMMDRDRYVGLGISNEQFVSRTSNWRKFCYEIVQVTPTNPRVNLTNTQDANNPIGAVIAAPSIPPATPFP